MARTTRREQWLALVLWLALGCRSGGGPLSTGTGNLLDGPTRWLMLPEEQKQAEKLRTTRDAVDFVEAFWLRRDPDPGQPGNGFAKTFYERVDAADHLYAEEGERGSLTDRGRALILLGPPPILRYGHKHIPTWDPGKLGTRPAIQSRTVKVEIWVYETNDLPPALAALIHEEEPATEQIELDFLDEGRRTRLVEGESYLDLAVRAAVHDQAQ